MTGIVSAGLGPVAGAIVVISDEGQPVAGAQTDEAGRFAIGALPHAGRYTVRALHPSYGADQKLVSAAEGEVALSLSTKGCFGYLDLPDPRLLVTDVLLSSWGAEPLARPCERCAIYRWFWEREGLTPVILTLEFLDDGVFTSVKFPSGDAGVPWAEQKRLLSPRRAERIDRAITRSGFWQLEHHDTSGACAEGTEGSSHWTIEAVASPGHRAVYRYSPLGSPLSLLGREWLRASGLRVRRKDFR